MSHRIYLAEFKDEAVRQVVDRGYTVKELAERQGISEASLYSWRKAVVPS
jgi:transposase